MRTKVFYEWDIEEFDLSFENSDDADIIDHDFHDKCPGVPTAPGHRLVLIRDVYKLFADGEPYDCQDRQWAYVEDGKLPVEFDGGEKVPGRFHDELKRTQL